MIILQKATKSYQAQLLSRLLLMGGCACGSQEFVCNGWSAASYHCASSSKNTNPHVHQVNGAAGAQIAASAYHGFNFC
jgi:hypothetical protein